MRIIYTQTRLILWILDFYIDFNLRWKQFFLILLFVLSEFNKWNNTGIKVEPLFFPLTSGEKRFESHQMYILFRYIVSPDQIFFFLFLLTNTLLLWLKSST